MAASNETRVVPWYSMEEWRQVYKNVYSEKLADLESGLSRLLLWKTRVPKLPAGVECTLYLIQAIIRDSKTNDNSNDNNDLSLVYCTAIIRFVNLVSHLGQVSVRHQPIQSVAECFGIPDWLVMIRHEATHSKFPSLGILRPASRVALQWLHDNYWKQEGELTSDRVLPETTANATTTENEKSVPFDELPEKLKLLAADCLRFMKTNKSALKQQTHQPIKKGRKHSIKKQPAVEQLQNMFRQVLNLANSGKTTAEIFAHLLKDKKIIIEDFQMLFQFLKDHWSFPHFLEKLVQLQSNGNQSRSSVQEVVMGLVDFVTEGSAQTTKLNYDWMRIIREFLKFPNQETWDCVKKLLDLQQPPVEEKVVENIKFLLETYLAKGTDETLSGSLRRIYSLRELKPTDNCPETEETEKMNETLNENQQIEIVSSWALSSDTEWAQIPIGSLLGLGRNPAEVPELNLTWHKTVAAAERNGPTSPKKRRVSEAFDWGSLVKKRRKRGGMGKSQPAINLV